MIPGSSPTPAPKQAVVSLTQTHHSGPLPDAQEFAQYEAVVPGAARELLDYARREAEHRHAIDLATMEQNKMVLRIEAKKVNTIRWGQVIGGLCATGVLGLAALAVLHGQGLAAVGLIAAELAALVWGVQLSRKREK